jgi:hypothetical protein
MRRQVRFDGKDIDQCYRSAFHYTQAKVTASACRERLDTTDSDSRSDLLPPIRSFVELHNVISTRIAQYLGHQNATEEGQT